jgi:hypothetical protein
MIKGEVKTATGIIHFELTPQKSLKINDVEEDPTEIYHPDQVIRMIDYAIADVLEWRVDGGEWVKYRD